MLRKFLRFWEISPALPSLCKGAARAAGSRPLAERHRCCTLLGSAAPRQLKAPGSGSSTGAGPEAHAPQALEHRDDAEALGLQVVGQLVGALGTDAQISLAQAHMGDNWQNT